MRVQVIVIKAERRAQFREYRQVFRKGTRPIRFPYRLTAGKRGLGFQNAQQLRDHVAKERWVIESVTVK